MFLRYCDKALQNLLHKGQATEDQLFMGLNIPDNEHKGIVQYLQDRKHIKSDYDQFDGFIMTPTNAGSLFGHTTSYEKETHEQELKERKLKVEVVLNEWLLKTKWLPHIVSIMSLIVAIIALFKK